MAERIRIEHRSYANVLWQISIHDKNWGGSYTAMTCARGGFQLDYKTSRREKTSPFMSSSLSIVWVVENSDHENFLTALASAYEGRFRVTVYKDGIFWWAGIIFHDEVVVDDVHDKPFVKITAQDGIGLLKNKEYTSSSKVTFIQAITGILALTDTADFWTSGADYLTTSINWWEDSMPTTGGNDPYALTRFSTGSFQKQDEAGNTDYESAYKILENILTITGARLMLSEGKWRIHQIDGYTSATQREIVYDKSGAALSYDLAKSFDLTVDNSTTTNHYRRSGQNRLWSPFGSAKIVYKPGDANNVFAGQEWSNTSAPGPANMGEVGSSSADEGFTLTAIIQHHVQFTNSDPVLNRHKFGFVIKVGSYYLKRTITQYSPIDWSYGAAEWTTTFSYYEYMTDDFADEINHVYTIFIETPDVPVQDILTVDAFLLESQWLGGIEGEIFVDEPSGTIFEWSIYNVTLPSTSANNTYIYESQNTSAASQEWKYTSRLGDLPQVGDVKGKLEIYNGSSWEHSYDWRFGTTGTTDRLLQLAVDNVIAINHLSTTGWDGGIIGTNFEPYKRFTFDSTNYFLAYRCRYNSDEDEWRAIASFIIDRDTSHSSPQPPVETPTIPANPPLQGPPVNDGGNDGPSGPATPSPTPGPVPWVNGYMTQGFTESIPASNLEGTQISAGDTITITNPQTGFSQVLEVAKDYQQGDGEVYVYAYLTSDFPPGSTIQVAPKKKTGAASGNALVDAIAKNDDTVQQDEHPIFTEGVLEYPQNAGTSGVEGVRIDSEGVKSWLSTSTKPIFHIKSDDNYAAADALEFYPWSSVLSAGVNGRVWYYSSKNVLVFDIGYSGYQYPCGLFEFSDTVIPYNTTVTTGVKDAFWVVPSRYHNLRWRDYQIGCNTYGSGSGSNTLSVRINGTTIVTASFNSASNFLLASPVTLAVGDVISLNVASLKSTPPVGLYFAMQLIV